MEKRADRTIALLGNPNVGKTTVFNILTGSRQTVGNWPGVTVEHKRGRFAEGGLEISVIDLPGIYSLTAGTPDEKVSRDYLLTKRPDLVINIVDASNLERNLYLTLQLLEMRVPVLAVLTMLDIAEQNGIEIDTEHLRGHLGCSVVPLRLYHRESASGLKAEILSRLSRPCETGFVPCYDEVVELGLVKIGYGADLERFDRSWDRRWLALKLLEQDGDYLKLLKPEENAAVQQVAKSIEKHRRQDIRNVIADDRYGLIRGLVKDVVKRKAKARATWSDRIDGLVLNGLLGLPIFFLVMFLVFSLTIWLSQPLVALISKALGWLLVGRFGLLLRGLAVPGWLADFLSNGLGAGLVTIATFIPPILFIFISLAWLEDSGYMARAAFVADRFMRRIGLPGKAFIPLLVGFGCTVPAIMATRTLENRRDRVMTSLLTPFMSCGAKLPVYAFLAMIFFPKSASLVVFGLYLTGIILALATGFLLKKTLFKSQPADFIMELPAYHLPTFNGIMMHAWHRLKDFILRAGKTILVVIAVMYVLQMITLPAQVQPWPGLPAQAKRVSLMELAGKAVSPAFEPMGIARDNWPASVALLSGLFAKEAIVGSLQSLYASGTDESAGAEIRQRFGDGVSGFAYLLFILLYSPCAAALAMLWREHGKGWMAFAFGFLTLQAWLVATLFYRLFNLPLDPTGSLFWLAVVAAVFVIQYWLLFAAGRKYAASV